MIAFFKTGCIIENITKRMGNIMATITRMDLANTLRNRFGLTAKMLKSLGLEHLKYYPNLHALVAIQKQVFRR